MPANQGSPAAARHPYFRIRKLGDRIETQGRPTAAFGHRIESARHTVDDGVFAHWQWDGKRLVAGNDRYGFCPLFWSRIHGTGICISPSILALIEQGAPTDLDVEALSIFFRLGHFVGEDTPFTAIKALPPNADFTWRNGNLECHARYPASPKRSDISRDDAIDGYITLFAQAMARRRPPTDFAVPASGGRDSRHILLQLHEMGLVPTICVSEKDPPPDPNEDPIIAARLCRELGFKHITVEHELSVFAAQLRKTPEVNFCEVPDGWFLPIVDFLGQRFDCIYDGIAGDVLSQSSYLNPEIDAVFRSRQKDRICRKLLGTEGSANALLTKLLRGELEPAAHVEVAIKRLRGEIDKHLDAHNPVGSFIFWNRTRRKIATGPYGLLREIACVYAPYLDHDLYDFLTSLPASLLMDRALHTEAIARAYPAFANIPYANHKAAPPVDSRGVKAQYLSEAGRRFLLRRPSSLMNTAVPRAKMLASILSRGHVNPWISPLVVYLSQIESAVSGYDRARQ